MPLLLPGSPLMSALWTLVAASGVWTSPAAPAPVVQDVVAAAAAATTTATAVHDNHDTAVAKDAVADDDTTVDADNVDDTTVNADAAADDDNNADVPPMPRRRKSCAIGISIGKSPLMQPGNAVPLVTDLISRGYTDILIVITDDLAQFNMHVFGNKSLATGSCLRHVKKEGDRVERVLREQLTGYDDVVTIVRWCDVHNAAYQRLVDVVMDAAAVENSFMDTMLTEWSTTFARHRSPTLKLTGAKMQSMRNFAMWEIPSITKGFSYNGIDYTDLYYPCFKDRDTPAEDPINVMLNLRESIQTSPELADVWAKLGELSHPNKATLIVVPYAKSV